MNKARNIILCLIACLITVLAARSNVTGFVNLNLFSGFNMIANQVDDDYGNLIKNVFRDKLDEGTIFYKYNGLSYDILMYDLGQWIGDTNMSLNAGEGCFVLAPNDKLISLTGDVIYGELILNIPYGFSIFSSMAPVKTDLSSVNVNFPLEDGDLFYKWNKTNQNYEIISYDLGEWYPQPLVLEVGESAWIFKASENDWVREFDVK